MSKARTPISTRGIQQYPLLEAYVAARELDHRKIWNEVKRGLGGLCVSHAEYDPEDYSESVHGLLTLPFAGRSLISVIKVSGAEISTHYYKRVSVTQRKPTIDFPDPETRITVYPGRDIDKTELSAAAAQLSDRYSNQYGTEPPGTLFSTPIGYIPEGRVLPLIEHDSNQRQGFLLFPALTT